MKIIELDNTLDQVKANPDRYRDLFFENKVLVFKGMNLSTSELTALGRHLGFGDIEDEHFVESKKALGKGGWAPARKSPKRTFGSCGPGRSMVQIGEDHKARFEQFAEGLSPASEFMFWHLEDSYQEFPPLVIVMSFTTFTCPSGAGNTGFVDMADAYKAMPPEWQHGLRDATKAEVQVPFIPYEMIQYPHPVVCPHWHSGEPFLPLQGYGRGCEEVPYSIDIDTCDGLTEDDVAGINEWVLHFLVDPENQHWLDHEQGDVVIWDAYSLPHAIKGGFSLGERVFDRVAYHGGEMTDEGD
jgi:alpha-ketoglutarate-dependent taurine dioxygenase